MASNKDKYKEIKKTCNEFYSEMDKFITCLLENYQLPNQEYVDDLKKYLLGQSKQIRSCLIFLLAKNFGYSSNDKDIVKLATAVEIIHNASLIHDDIIDDAKTRRSQVAIHYKYSNKLGVISGDFLISIAFNLLLDLPNDIIKEFSVCFQSLCYGEIQQYFALKKTPTLVDYFKKSEMKTASLFVAGLVSFAKLKQLKIEEEIKKFSLHFGRAFQFRDDLKNIISIDENKPILNDIETGIYCAPVIFAYGENQDLSNESTEKIMQKAKDDKNIEQTKKLINYEIEQAISIISILPNNEYKKLIIELVELLCL